MQNTWQVQDWQPAMHAALKRALQPAVLLRSLFAATTIWLIMASLTPSYSRLIFQGKLAGYFAAGLGIALVSEIAIGLVSGLFSSDEATMAFPQSPTAVILGIIASEVIAAAPADMSPQALFGAVFWVIILSSLLTGITLLLLGIVRAGGLVRYLPYPIVGGFLAGLGWLLVQASFLIAVETRLNLAALPMLLEGAVLIRWLPAVLMAVLILAIQARIKNYLIVPGMILAAFVLFYLVLHLSGASVESLSEAGWFLPKVPSTLSWQLPDFGALGHINSSMLLASAGGIITLMLFCILNLVFRASGQELLVGRELDINRECAVNGAANIVSSLVGGGIVGYPAPAQASLVQTLGAYGRLVSVILAVMFGLTLLVGGVIFAIVPRFVPAGLLMYIGLRYLKEWLWNSRAQLPRQDYFVIFLIALSTAFIGLLPGVAVGIVLAIFFFVLEYSRMDVIKQEFTASNHRSHLDRSFAQNQVLQRQGKQVLILRLQGYVFFGTAYRLYEHIKAHIYAQASQSLRMLALDFESVRGLDVSSIQDFQKLKKLTDKYGVELLVSGVQPHLQATIADSAIAERKGGGTLLFDDLDHALEWCENALLREADLLAAQRITVAQQLAQHAMVAADDAQALEGYLERIEAQAGDIIFAQDDPPDALYFIETGRVDVLLGAESDRALRLRSIGAGTVIGEVGFYLKQARSAAVVATEPCILQRLSLDALRDMEMSAPRAASALHVHISCILSDRLSVTNRVIQELMD